MYECDDYENECKIMYMTSRKLLPSLIVYDSIVFISWLFQCGTINYKHLVYSMYT